MGIIRRLRCPACGSMKSPDKFTQAHDAEATLNVIGGRAGCTWTKEPMTMDEAKLVRQALRRALQELEAGIAAAGGD